MKYIIPILSLAVLGLSGCSKSKTDAAPVMEPVAKVTLASAIRGDMPVIKTGFGIVEFDPSKQHTVNSQIEARVLEVKVITGSSVKSGQGLIRLVPSAMAGLDITRVRRDAAAAQAAAERAQRLRIDGLASDADVESAVTYARDLAEQASSLEARAVVIKELKAPISGIIDAVLVEPGDIVAPGSQMIRLAAPDAIQARIGVEIEDVNSLKSKDKVMLHTLDKSAGAVSSSIRAIDSRVDPNSRMAAILVDVPPGQGFLSGQAVKAQIIVDTLSSVVIVPRASVFADETGSYVFTAKDNMASLSRIVTGLTNGEQTEVKSGLAVGDSVIIEGAAILSDGMKIRTDATVKVQTP